MSQAEVIRITQNALYTIIIISAPMIGFGLIVGLIVSIFQAVTQIHEQTLVFIPKILAVMAAMVIFGPWMLSKLIKFTTDLFMNINNFIK
ncbi:MAG: flagellar biosynthesis protein FliQ [Clostridia bacterium]|nr:flagellar biosynthesis protein FliQ [Clostridia bacterium]